MKANRTADRYSSRMRFAMGASALGLLCLVVAYFVGGPVAWGILGLVSLMLLVLAMSLSWREMRDTET